MKLINQLRHSDQFKLWLVVLLSIVTTIIVHAAEADTLKDPTQPPASLYSEAGEGQEVVSVPVLQSVMIGPQYRAAIINGEKILLGKKYQQATLIRLNEHEAVLQNTDMTTQTLLIDYTIEKKIVLPVASPSATKIKVKHSSKPIEVSEN
jgi:MSHA biogenesis protein MshK